ncbi:MAG: redoxin domain-containing protein [Deltaproteobacteria bacterium]|nr:redoxin domain-containing protein [Deltaproteobacteria bacterium]
MRTTWKILLLSGIFIVGLTEIAKAEVEVGSPAPDFCLPSSKGNKVCLKDFKGKDNVLLLFYVLDFTPG